MSWDERLSRGDPPRLRHPQPPRMARKTPAQRERERRLSLQEDEMLALHEEVVAPSILRVQELWGSGEISPVTYEVADNTLARASQDVRYLMTGNYDLPEKRYYDNGVRSGSGNPAGGYSIHSEWRVHNGMWMIKRAETVYVEGSISTFSGYIRETGIGSTIYEVGLNDNFPDLYTRRRKINLTGSLQFTGGAGRKVRIDPRRLSEAKELVEENTYSLMKYRYESGAMPGDFAGNAIIRPYDNRPGEPL